MSVSVNLRVASNLIHVGRFIIDRRIWHVLNVFLKKIWKHKKYGNMSNNKRCKEQDMWVYEICTGDHRRKDEVVLTCKEDGRWSRVLKHVLRCQVQSKTGEKR